MKLALNLALCALAGASGCAGADGAGGPEPRERQEPTEDDARPTDAGEREDRAEEPRARADAGDGVGEGPGPRRDAAANGSSAGSATNGRAGSFADDESCQEVTAEHQVTAPDMLIMLDRSGSMIGFGEELGVDRWGPSRTAVATITAEFQDLISFGLSLFAAPDPSGIDLFSCATGRIDVPIALRSSAAIIQAIDGATPFGGATPTGATLEVAAELLGDRTGNADGKAVPGYVLLVTDGEPTCEEGPTEATPAAVDRANAAIDRLSSNGVKTYVVGYGLSGAAAVMDGFAQRGGTEHYYAVEDGAQLIEEFRRITTGVITCAYELKELPRDRLKVEVKLDGTQLNLDPANGDGWTLKDTTVTLVGAPCARLKDGQHHELKIRELCEEVAPI